eukprot:CAMPEP_0114656402 /NCGR_PEP_ID=MMETSP0191-20121206/12293_1 /TAXON_ID=126664 /ORGANISM="Sorites sp." /LENGTH=469 /DNA_ID=CAMNT_0001873551 /DNA_START=36 /DNA_END=1445 /DNA_ORIENTATION=+
MSCLLFILFALLGFGNGKYGFREYVPVPKRPIFHSSSARRTIKNGILNRGVNIHSGDVINAPPVEALNVLDYGADITGDKDSTDAFKNALNAAFNQKGGFVYAPTGKYKFLGQISIPDGVSLVGSYLTVPQHEQPTGIPDDGTVFLPYYGRGELNETFSFITVGHSAALQGVTILYPDNPCGDSIPVAYPPTIRMNQPNSAIFDIELLNSYYGVYAVEAHRHFISRIQGQPIFIGLYIDQTYDIGRIENVHWNPWFCKNTNYMYTQTTYGEGFLFARSDWEYVFNTFAFAYAVGYHFIETPSGAMNGNFVGIGADYAVNVSVLVDASQKMGLLIVNGEFTAYHNSQFAPNATSLPVAVQVNKDNIGNVNFQNTAFWGPMQYCAQLYGDSTTIFEGCVFVDWDDHTPNGSPCIHANNGNVVLIGNTFQKKGIQAVFDAGTKKAIATSNIVTDGVNMKADSSVLTSFTGNL